MKICPVGAGFFHADKQTAITKFVFALWSFAKATNTFCEQSKTKLINISTKNTSIHGAAGSNGTSQLEKQICEILMNIPRRTI
jgi:hypothetical protein